VLTYAANLAMARGQSMAVQLVINAGGWILIAWFGLYVDRGSATASAHAAEPPIHRAGQAISAGDPAVSAIPLLV
jgi:hypothetical protein